MVIIMNNSFTSAKHLIDAALERYTDQILEKASRGKQWALLHYSGTPQSTINRSTVVAAKF